MNIICDQMINVDLDLSCITMKHLSKELGDSIQIKCLSENVVNILQ